MSSGGVYDNIIIGAGLYGLYAAVLLADRGRRVLVLESDPTVMRRATRINQARVHNGYHYPRSLSTAVKSAHYYRRFHEDFSFCIKSDFRQLYATSSEFSYTDREQFLKFTEAAGIPCSEENPRLYFKDGMVDGAFLTEEDTYDADILRESFLERIKQRSERLTLLTGADIYDIDIQSSGAEWVVKYRHKGGEEKAVAPAMLNASYASVNQVLSLVNTALKNAGEEPLKLFGIKYELCEIILCSPGERLKDIGITVMDGPFFSVMPFGRSGLHSLTAVTHTPHAVCRDDLPSFPCQSSTSSNNARLLSDSVLRTRSRNSPASSVCDRLSAEALSLSSSRPRTVSGSCSPTRLENCDDCKNRPVSAWPYMRRLAEKYLLPEYSFDYRSSLFSMKPILRSAEIDDSRPTAVRTDTLNGGARLVSVLSGKINTVYDLDEVLK